MAQFFQLDNFTLHLYERDSEYLHLLTSPHYHNLDENGRMTDYPIEKGRHSMTEILNKLHRQDPVRYNDPKGVHFFLQLSRRAPPTPVVLWSAGNLRVVHARFSFPAGRDVLFVHRLPSLHQIPLSIRAEVIDDMIAYGYLVPNWVPLFTRHMCAFSHDEPDPSGRESGLHSYHPYSDPLQ
jgi:hypothetical protein